MTVSRRTFLTGTAGAVAAAYAVPDTAWADDRPLRADRLTTGHLSNPLGVMMRPPRFGWRLLGSGHDRRQSAYQLRVTRSPIAGSPVEVWDSGRVESADQSAIGYAGPTLQPRARHRWTVRVWDEAGRVGPWSRPAWFETALPDEPWQAAWIGSGIVLPVPTRTLEPANFTPDRIVPGHELGQTFAVAGSMSAVAVLLTVSAESADVELVLRRDRADGEEIARGQVTVGPEEAQARLDLAEPLGEGRYYLGVTSPTEAVAWQSRLGDEEHGSPYPDGAAIADGEEVALLDRWLYAVPSDPPPNPRFRHTFRLDRRPASARLYLVGLGHGQAMINGRAVSDQQLTPPFTDYTKRVLYTTHDVTQLVRRGENAIGVDVGRGLFATRAADSDGTNLQPWTSEPQILAQLEITLDDGQRVVVGSGPAWRLTEGPTVFDGLYTGETYDARRARELDGWTTASYDDGGWTAARQVPPPQGRLEPYPHQPIRRHRPLKPTAVREPEPGVWLYDFGEVVSGWVRVRGRAAEGAVISILQHEKLGQDGRIDPGTPGGVDNPSIIGRLQRDEHVAAGGPVDWQPSWAHKSFQYVEVTGTSERPDVVAVPVRTDLDTTLDLEVDQPNLQWIVEAAARTSRNGMHGHPDTSSMLKMGWLAQGLQADTTQLLGLSSAPLFDKWLDDIRVGQLENGSISHYTPIEPFPQPVTPSTTAAYPHLVHRYYLHHGDRTVPERHYSAIHRYVELLLTLHQEQDGELVEIFGDWYPPSNDRNPYAPEGTGVVAAAYLIKTLRDAAAVADVAGEPAQADAWRGRAAELTDDFNERYLDRAAGIYRTGKTADYRQTSNAIPLHLELVPHDMIRRVADRLAAEVVRNDRHLDTGSFGTISLPYALSDHGHADLALDVLSAEGYPGYGYWRSLGATTFWEQWRAEARSHNDPTLSSPVGWMLARVVGLEPLEPGWARFRVAPRAFGNLAWARTHLDTPRGRIEVAWRQRGGGPEVTVAVPVNATAEVTLPGGATQVVGSGRHRVRRS